MRMRGLMVALLLSGCADPVGGVAQIVRVLTAVEALAYAVLPDCAVAAAPCRVGLGR